MTSSATGAAFVPGHTDVVYILPDKQGGVANVVCWLLRDASRGEGGVHGVVLTDNRNDTDTRARTFPSADWHAVVQHRLPLENVRTVLRRLASEVPRGPGVLVANDFLELAMVAEHDLGRAVVQIVHGDYDYYYGLAERYQGAIDAFVACSERIYQTLLKRLPERRESIFHLPYGIELPVAERRRRDGGPLRLCFVGRLAEGKGIFDLPEIDRRLAGQGIAVEWSVIGDGPARSELEGRAADTRLRLLGSLPPERVNELYLEHDVFVLPTRAEGFPIVLLEAMAAGVVPVVSDLPSGIPELVEPRVTGFRPEAGDIDGFVSAIAELSRNPEQLASLSHSARELIRERYESKQRAAAYQRLFETLTRQPATRRTATPRLGSRLDQDWIPNWVVRGVRLCGRRLRSTAAQ